MSKVEKSFQTLGLADGILDGVVSCLIDAEKKAKSSREIQTLDVNRRGLRQDLYVGKLMIIPHQVMDDTSKIPDPLLKGAVLRLFDGEEAACLEAHRLSTNEFDDLSDKDITEYKDKVFRDDTNKLGCVVIFQPAWANFRDYHAFRFTKDVEKLKLLVRHLVFSAYYNPSLSALFDTLTEEAVKLDAENITHEHLGPAYEFKGEEQSYPILDKGDEEKPTKAKKGGLKKRAEVPVESAIMKLSPDAFVQGYLEAAVWTGTDDNGDALDNDGKFSSDDFSPDALRKAEEDCTAFVQMAGDLIQPMDDGRAGHLFWLNRNGHGTGFWDEDTLDEASQKKLDELAHSFGECDLYVSDDGELEFQGGHIPAPPPAEGSGHVLPVTGKLRFASSNLPLILAADKETPEETAVLAELQSQLQNKIGSDSNFDKGANAGDAGSALSPIDNDHSGSGDRASDEDHEVADVTKNGGFVSIPPMEVPRLRGADTGEGTVKDNLSPRNEFKVTFEDGNTLNTGFNGTLEEANAYYVGHRFNFGDTAAHPADKMVRAVSVEQLNKTASPSCQECGKPTRNCKCMAAVHASTGLCHDCWKSRKKATSDSGVTTTGLRSQPDYGEADSYTAEANEQNAAPTKTRLMLSALLEKTASNEDLHNGYTEMREVIKSDFAKDDRSKETDHSKTASATSDEGFLRVLQRQNDERAAAQAEAEKCPKCKSTNHTEWANGRAWCKTPGCDGELPQYSKYASSPANIQAASQDISSVANRLVDQHCGEYFTKESLKQLLRNATANIQAVFNFMTEQGLLVPYGEGQFKIQTRTHSEDNQKTGLWNEDGDDDNTLCPNCLGPGTELGTLGSRQHFRCRDCGMDYSRQLEKTASSHKQALTYMHPGQVLEQFYPEVLKDVSNYPQGYAERNYSPPPLPLELRDNPDNAQVTTKDYDDQGMKHDKAEPGLIPSQDSNSVPLKPSEKSIRGPFFSDQFYRIHTDISPALLTMKSSLENKTASAPAKAEIIGQFLRKLAGEIASSLLAAFVMTDRPLFTNTPAYSSISLLNEGDYLPMNPILTTGGLKPYAAQLKALLNSVNDGELADAINDAWAQGGVWHGDEGSADRWLYEVFVRIESVDVETLQIRYKYVTGTKE